MDSNSKTVLLYLKGEDKPVIGVMQDCDDTDKACLNMVISGAKPGGAISPTNSLDESKLLVVPAKCQKMKTVDGKDYGSLYISLRGKLVSDVISPEQIEQYRDFDFYANIKRLYNDVKGMEVALALDYLMRKRLDDEDNILDWFPEIESLVGLLFGYNPCCVKYFLETRCFDGEKHELERAASAIVEIPHVLCRDCAEKLLAAADVSSLTILSPPPKS